MSEYQNTIDTMRAMAYADEGDRITSSDLNECDTAAAIIEDLEAELEASRECHKLAAERNATQYLKLVEIKAENADLENVKTAYVQSTIYWRDQANKLREGLERLLIATKGYSIPTHELMAAEKALQESDG
jgi:hypothetical protein